jgi:hypothetical protein
MPIIGRTIGGVFNCVIEGWRVVGAFTEERILTLPPRKSFRFAVLFFVHPVHTFVHPVHAVHPVTPHSPAAVSRCALY